MRLFVALSIPTELRDGLSSLVTELQQLDPAPRWANPFHLHVTLKFIGEVPAERLSGIAEALAEIPVAEPLPLELREIGFFPSVRRPAVVWMGIQASAELNRLAASVDERLASRGVARESRPFVPHLTLARCKEKRLSAALSQRLDGLKDRSFGRFVVAQFHLMESTLKRLGAEYTTLHSFPIAAEGARL